MENIEWLELYFKTMKIYSKNNFKEAAIILKNGGLIAFPTETVFGLGVIFNNESSYKRLIDVKKRPPEKPFTMMLSNVKDIERYAYIDENSRLLMEKFMPGQLTLILKAKENLPNYVVSKEGFVGVRVPDDKLIQKLIDEVGEPLLVPSANKSGEKPATTHQEVIDVFADEIDGVIEGSSKSNVPSTIVLVAKEVVVIREGLIKKEDIDKILVR